MGLDCSHDAFSGAYSAFNRLRQFVCAATGGSFPPHNPPQPNIPEDCFQCGDEYEKDEWPGLYEFLTHSDCDGEISPDMCKKVAEDLERLLPKMENLDWESYGHIAAQGGFVSVVRKFIAGVRAAATANEPLDFH